MYVHFILNISIIGSYYRISNRVSISNVITFIAYG